LAEAISRVRSSLVPILDKLEADGLLKRRPSPTDRRLKCVSLTTTAITPEMACLLADLFEAFAAEPGLLVLVVAGAGGKAFCSGGDLDQSLPLLTGARLPQTAYDERVLADPDIMARAVLRMPQLEKPVIAAVNGYCLAGGMEMLLGTDIRIAADHASFGLPEARHGLIPFAVALARLAQQIPTAIAMEMLLTGPSISASEAFRLGLVNHVVPATDVLPRALALADTVAANGPLAVRQIKRTVQASVGRPLADAFALEDKARAIVMASADARDGPAAFIQKRRPQFQGR
jgi:enoyl-CoA hydratase